jgi:hypothetical protein
VREAAGFWLQASGYRLHVQRKKPIEIYTVGSECETVNCKLIFASR